MSAVLGFTFLRPWLLLALIPLAALWLPLRRPSEAEAPGVGHIAPHLLAALTIGATARAKARAADLLFAAAALMTLAAAGPAWRAAPSPFVTETAPLVIALDLSPSMDMGDVAPTRLERAKQKIRDLIARRAGGRVGLVAYSGTAHLVMPLTDDPTVLLPFLEALSPAIMPDEGRAASAALTLAGTLLGQEESPGSVLFVTDGIDPSDIANFPEGGPARAALVVSPDPGAEIADWSRRAGVRTVPVSIDASDLRAVERALASSLARAAAREGRRADDGWMLAVPAGLLMLFWFRRGTALRLGAVLIGLALAAPPSPARAAGFGETLSGWFWTPDQRGARFYAAHDYPEAAEAFADPEWRALALMKDGKYTDAAALLAPIQTSAAQYNRGIALVRSRDYAGGQAAFEAALRLDPGNAEAADNLATTKRIIAYLSEVREQEDTEEGAETPDEVVSDLSGDEGKPARIDARAQLSEAAAEEWMRSVETRPADFLKSRFAIEAAPPPAGSP
ncbi:VWA domain-containing protein [Amaricoccus solimangrovi]|uniref:VWA domain-containing protein n=1 Tax=Amaricoccus solimangrovi TaxID=2589815 RepID=A0A501WDN9_9RHOB|nr:VWA domain-containing protein [Amaricoccus solimangrovi]TPE46952.1 VWA domain-containing protein [Amaricoccus solimangrovi]